MPATKTAKREELEQLWPDLSFHYGWSFSDLALTPKWAVDMYAEALPRLLASAQLRAIEAASFPKLDEGSRDGIMGRLKRHLGVSAEPRAPRNEQELRMMAAASGVGVVMEPAPEKVS